MTNAEPYRYNIIIGMRPPTRTQPAAPQHANLLFQETPSGEMTSLRLVEGKVLTLDDHVLALHVDPDVLIIWKPRNDFVTRFGMVAVG